MARQHRKKKSSSLKRTTRRVSLPLNRGKWDRLQDLTQGYAREKDDYLLDLAPDRVFAEIGSHETARDGFLDADYDSPHGLQNRQWKMALKDAFETIDKQWASLAEKVRGLVGKQEGWTDAEKHYAYWLLGDPHRLAALCGGKAPEPDHFELSRAERRRVRNYLRRVIRRQRGKAPRVKKARSFTVDANMYSVFEHEGRQYIKLMSLLPRDRIVIPLAGHATIRGNLRIILDRDRQRVEVHVVTEVKARRGLAGEVAAVDAGVTEVFTDELGNRYGKDFGKALATYSDRVCDQGRKRSKLRAVAEKARARGDEAKAKRIEKNNLGTKKRTRSRHRMRGDVERRINEATNEVLERRSPKALITERLDIRGKAKSKRLSRIVASWARGTLKERVELKASAGHPLRERSEHMQRVVSRREQVNASYSSQTCPIPACGFVHRDNRRGDKFQCLRCGYTGESDVVAATNLKARYQDPEILLFTPKERVKSILQARFNARLEAASAATVSGRTGETVTTTLSGQRGRRKPTGGRVESPSIPPRQSQSETTGAIPSHDGRKVIHGRADPCPLEPRIGENTGAKRDYHV